MPPRTRASPGPPLGNRAARAQPAAAARWLRSTTPRTPHAAARRVPCPGGNSGWWCSHLPPTLTSPPPCPAVCALARQRPAAWRAGRPMLGVLRRWAAAGRVAPLAPVGCMHMQARHAGAHMHGKGSALSGRCRAPVSSLGAAHRPMRSCFSPSLHTPVPRMSAPRSAATLVRWCGITWGRRGCRGLARWRHRCWLRCLLWACSAAAAGRSNAAPQACAGRRQASSAKARSALQEAAGMQQRPRFASKARPPSPSAASTAVEGESVGRSAAQSGGRRLTDCLLCVTLDVRAPGVTRARGLAAAVGRRRPMLCSVWRVRRARYRPHPHRRLACWGPAWRAAVAGHGVRPNRDPTQGAE